MECAANDETVDATEALIPTTPRVVGPHSQRGGYGNGDGRGVGFNPITIVPQSSLDGVSRHGAVVVATLATTSKLFDVVLRPNIAASPITTIKQLRVRVVYAHGARGVNTSPCPPAHLYD